MCIQDSPSPFSTETNRVAACDVIFPQAGLLPGGKTTGCLYGNGSYKLLASLVTALIVIEWLYVY